MTLTQEELFHLIDLLDLNTRKIIAGDCVTKEAEMRAILIAYNSSLSNKLEKERKKYDKKETK